MKITDEMALAAQAVAPNVDKAVIVSILQAGLLEASSPQLSALCRGVARVLAVVDTPTGASYTALVKVANQA